MKLRRAFVVVWIVLAVAGALAHTVAERAVGHTIDLGLPNLQYGYVMFNANPRRVPVYTYAHGDGERHDLADLDPRPAFGYKRARVGLDAMFSATYLRDLCNRALTSRDDVITIYIDGYQVDVDRDKPAMSTTEVCRGHR